VVEGSTTDDLEESSGQGDNIRVRREIHHHFGDKVSELVFVPVDNTVTEDMDSLLYTPIVESEGRIYDLSDI